MNPVFASLVLFAACALAQFTINTPASVVECEPVLLSWSGGTSPYFLSILPGSSPSATAIESFPATNSTSLTWTCNIQAGTSIGFTLRDSTGAIAQTAPLSVTAGTSTTCTNVTSVVAGSTAAAASATPASASTTGGSAASKTSASATGSASPSSAGTSSSGASANAAQLGAAGIVAVAIAAFFL